LFLLLLHDFKAGFICESLRKKRVSLSSDGNQGVEGYSAKTVFSMTKLLLLIETSKRTHFQTVAPVRTGTAVWGKNIEISVNFFLHYSKSLLIFAVRLSGMINKPEGFIL
jgi:hypothetical protein